MGKFLKWVLAMAVMALFPGCQEDCCAAPALRKDIALYQPDGTSFMARLRGDEFMKILTTTDGYVIGQDNDGWYCYAYYNEDGCKVRTEYKAGQDAPAEIKSRSRMIPYGMLRAIAAGKRAKVNDVEKESVLARIKASRGTGTKSEGTIEEKHGIVILAQFKDLKFQDGHTKDSFVKMLTEPGYSYNGAKGSAMDYFNTQFEGQYTFSFDVSDIVTLSNGFAYYGKNDSSGDDVRAAEMIEEACRLADSQIDFSKYDDDGDGEVDNVFVFFAGGDEAEYAGDDHIWSHAWYLWNGAMINLTLDGVRINRYACTAELHRLDTGNSYVLSGIGTFCHEFSHTLGLADYYDTDYEESGGISDALWGSTALMDSGNQNNEGNTPPNFNAIDRDAIGIWTAEELAEGTHVLEPIDVSGKYYRMDTDNEGEYFLFECRTDEGWDRYIGGSGLLIYHIDKSKGDAGFSSAYGRTLSAERRWQYNEVNCNPAHQCADLVEAYPMAGNVSQIFFPYMTSSVSHKAFTPLTEPAFVFWDGTESPLAITDIARQGKNIVLTVSKYDGAPSGPAGVVSEIFQDAAIITWNTAMADKDSEMVIRWKRSSGSDEYQEATVKPYDAEGRMFSFTIEGLTPRTSYKCEITQRKDDIEKTVPCNFMTKSTRNYKYPFIYLYNMEKNEDGTFPAGSKFPLRLFNAYDAAEIVWTMDGKTITPDASGYYIPSRSGEMKAVIYYEDGTKAAVSKTITIR